jgi:hypothetical protein
VNTAEMSVFFFLYPFCTILNTIASLLPTGNFFQKQLRLNCLHKYVAMAGKKIVSEKVRHLGYLKILYRKGLQYKKC